jgi:uncharacterized protein (DUF4213/DUF364 family)
MTPMKLEDALLSSIDDDIRETPVKGAWVGLHWMAVEGAHVGMAHTFKTGRKYNIRDAGGLDEFRAYELAERLISWEPIEASLGVAALNSFFEPGGKEGNVSSLIKREVAGKTLTVVGRFPFNEDIARSAKKAYFLEMEPKDGEYPASACEDLLPGSDVNVISATALINHTLQRLLELGSGGLNIVLGPSTPFSPVMFEFGADVLAGVRVVDPRPLVRSITQGAKKFNDLLGTEPVYVEKGSL